MILPAVGVFADLAAQCRACLGAQQRGETIVPRSEVVDYCVALLLAAGELDYLSELDKRSNINLNVELATHLAAICYDLQRDRERPSRKNSKSFWDIIVPVFNPSSSSMGTAQGSSMKRTSTGAFQFNVQCLRFLKLRKCHSLRLFYIFFKF